MLRSLFSGVSGMKSQQTKLDIIGNNIANVNTTAFKSGRVTFKDMLSQTLQGANAPVGGKGGTNPKQAGLGVAVAGIDTNMNQGGLQPTGRNTDLAIEGNGFFVISDGTETRYTRDGSFTIDKNGNLVTSDGYNVLGAINPDISVSANGTVSAVFPQTNNGAMGDITVSGNATAPWQNGGDIIITSVDTSGQVTGVKYRIDGTDSYTSLTGLSGSATINGSTFTFAAAKKWYPGSKVEVSNTSIGSAPTIGLFTSTTPLIDATTSPNSLKSIVIPLEATINGGTAPTKLTSFGIEKDGTIRAVYGDTTVAIGKIAVANFQNSAGLTKMGGNAYMESMNSGSPNIGTAAEDGCGTIQQGILEMSNVDLANEFTEMIITSRAFQANSRTITTSDEILQELLNLKR